MSDLTFGFVQDMTGLIWGPPVSVANHTLASTIRAGYDLIVNDIQKLVSPPLQRIETSPMILRANTCIRDRALRLAQAAGISSPTVDLNLSSPALRISNPLEASRSSAGLAGLNTAPPIIKRSHDLMTRAELSCARAQALIADSPLLIRTREWLQDADAAISRGDMEGALQAARKAMQLADELEQQISRATATEMAQARQAADAIARAGALWTGLHTQEAVHSWLIQHASKLLECVAQQLREARSEYTARQFAAARQRAQTVESELDSLIELAVETIATRQRDHLALEAAQVLRQMGYEIQASEKDDRRVISAAYGGRPMLTIAFDNDGRFEIDSRAGYKGSAACSVAVNHLLRALAQKMKLEIEGRTFVGKPDGDPGRAARTRSPRRRLATADILAETERPVSVAPHFQQVLATAWSTIAC